MCNATLLRNKHIYLQAVFIPLFMQADGVNYC